MKAIVAAACLLFAPISSASDYQHALSAGAGFGDTKDSADHSSDSQAHYDLAYRYQFTSEWGVEVGYMQQEPVFRVSNQQTDIDSFRASALYTLPLSKRNRLVFKLGINHTKMNSSDIQSNSGGRFSSNDTGLLAGLGWRVEFASGMDLGLTYHYQAMDILDIQTMTFALGYRF